MVPSRLDEARRPSEENRSAVTAEAWPVSSAGQPCQRFKSRDQTEKALGLMASGKFLAWMIIDAGAAVYKYSDDPDMDTRGLDLQKWGWYNRYLLAYLDGGYIPTTEMMVTENMVTKPVVVMTTQKLYYPRTVLAMGTNGMPGPAPGYPGRHGPAVGDRLLEVLAAEAARGPAPR